MIISKEKLAALVEAAFMMGAQYDRGQPFTPDQLRTEAKTYGLTVAQEADNANPKRNQHRRS